MTNGLRSILPAGVALAEADADELASDHQSGLYASEVESLGGAVESRRREFALGRRLARRALAGLGIGPVAIPRGRCREPIWPPGVVGSITHCDGYAAAAVAPRSRLRSLGIDAEPRRPLPPDALRLIATDAERAWLAGAAGDLPWDAVLFSAKESVFKAWFPVAGTWLGFEEAEVRFRTGTFQARLNPTADADVGHPTAIHGRYDCGPTHVVTCAALPNQP